MSSEVSICNQAISWLGGNLITSLGDSTTEAILCNANYAELRDAVMEEGKWTFATKRFKLLPSTLTPVYGYSNQFEIPNGVLSVIQATQYADNLNTTEDFDWRREENFIVANVDAVYCKCIIQIVDPKKFSKTFNQALAARIAADIAPPLTESTSKEEKMWAKYYHLLPTALAVDGMQGKSDRIKTNSRIVNNR
jgi:hypothetical protein